VSRLLLSDFDWREEVFVVNYSKREGSRRYPLQREVSDAILQYLNKPVEQTSSRDSDTIKSVRRDDKRTDPRPAQQATGLSHFLGDWEIS
jgi:hypothetical protein